MVGLVGEVLENFAHRGRDVGMALTKEETARLFQKLEDLTESSIRVEERVENIKEDVMDLKTNLKDHELKGDAQYQGLRSSVGVLKGRVSVLEARKIPKGISIMGVKGLIAAIAGLISAIGVAWATFR